MIDYETYLFRTKVFRPPVIYYYISSNQITTPALYKNDIQTTKLTISKSCSPSHSLIHTSFCYHIYKYLFYTNEGSYEVRYIELVLF